MPISDDEMCAYLKLPAGQQPDWGDRWLVNEVMADIAALPELVSWKEVRQLRSLLAEAAYGRLLIVQAGDCAEDLVSGTADKVSRKVGLLHALAGVLQLHSGLPVIRVGRIAGQFAKPRSRPTERVGDVELPVFRGLIVNAPEPESTARRPDPLRLLAGHRAARETVRALRWRADAWTPLPEPPVWTSHEALLLDYELPQLRRSEDGRTLLTSTHWPWIGERTRDPEGAHVRLLADLVNPVACKVGPECDPDTLLRLCERLDPRREPGRLTLIARFGAGRAPGRLSGLVSAVRAAGHPVIWMCDPLHGNTVTAPSGVKTRTVSAIAQELGEFLTEVHRGRGVAGGLHLETTPEDVVECVADPSAVARAGRDGAYTTLCDPRLNSRQALDVAAHWLP
ncbi:3-deoxy-7-phosphoheptulonate synthase [Streptomyces sp. NPDC046976]|uniref:3-deoxy-7-phosphoheptulonate synthase n=1 Tax=Streptomyces sp. NPDC046976 TaxID=3155258 RepID=UPI0033F88E3D